MASLQMSPLIISTIRKFVYYFWRASQGQSALYGTQRLRYRVVIKSQLVLNVAGRFLHIRNRVVD